MNLLSNNNMYQIRYLKNSSAIDSDECLSFALEYGGNKDAEGLGRSYKDYVNPSLGMGLGILR